MKYQFINYLQEKIKFKRYLLVLVLIFTAGIILSGVINPGLFFMFTACVLILIFAAISLLKQYQAANWLVYLLVLCLGMFWSTIACEKVDCSLLKYCNHYVTIEGEINKAPVYRADSMDYILQIEEINIGRKKKEISGQVLAKVRGKENGYSYGDRVRVKGVLRRPPSSGNPGEFDYREYLKRRNVVAVMYVSKDDIAKISGSFPGINKGASFLRGKIMELNRETLSPVHSSVLNGMMFGARGEIPKHIEDVFSRSGLAHVLCVSGVHVGIILGGLFIIFNFLGVSASRLPFWSAPLLLFYAAMTGFGPAVTRAVIMAVMLLWAHRLRRDRDWPTTLAAAALVILLFDPLQLYEASFQLSFAATWGILYLSPYIGSKLELIRFVPRQVIPVVQVTLAAQLATLPVIINYFNIVSFIAVLTNLLALPALSIILFMGFTAGLAGLLIPFAANLINAGTGILIGALVWLVCHVQEIPLAYYYFPSWPWWGVILWYAVLIVTVEWSDCKKLFSAVSPYKFYIAFAFLILCTFFFILGQQEDKLKVHIIDVGQGDSILVHTPRGENMLVDAGGWRGELNGEPGAGDYVVVPYLKRLGINCLDVLALTHFHEDHAGGAESVLDEIGAKRLVIPSIPADTLKEPEIKNILNKAVEKGLPVNLAAAGDKLLLDEKVKVLFLGPPETPFKGSRSDPNNNSLVMLISYGDADILLTGDIEEEMQSYLVKNSGLKTVDILKVPHHGSSYYTPEFIKKVKPKIAVISVGENNNFGFPDKGLIETFHNMGTRVYRTDQDGAVIISTGGRTINVRTGR
ncbi:MAG: DNA internalization-related competence protein ComEC/Rec2 [Clostridiales bacterium]|nr:DNA internalization-related competence protein ComEC/Rec2 [Clostridiales bacterium]MCF8022952.1 DNA internalization-related competence protein ComEC/Rec2 [Clostridiales bacterium]